MARGTATLLLLMFVLLPLTPLLAGGADASVPACCRRDGKHHCMKGMAQVPAQHKHLTSGGMKCPTFPKLFGTSSLSTNFIPAGSQSYYAAIVSHPSIHAQVETSYRICWSRSQQKRGPPLFAL